MHLKTKKALEGYQVVKTLFIFCELLIIISIILTFFLLYELSVISQSSLVNRGIVYIFILFSVQVLSMIFNGYHEVSSQIFKFFFIAIALVFSVFLLAYIRTLPQVSNNTIPFAISIALVVILSLLVICNIIGVVICWKYEMQKRYKECRFLLGEEGNGYYSSVMEEEEEYIPSRRSKK